MRYDAYVIRADRIAACLAVDAEYDFEAVHLCSRMRPVGDALEVWQKARFIARVDPSGEVRQGPDYVPREPMHLDV